MNAIESAIYTALTSAGALTSLLATTTSVFFRIGHPGNNYPMVVFEFLSETDDNKSPHRAKQLLYSIKGIVHERRGLRPDTGPNADLVDAGAIDLQIDAIFHLKVLTVTGWTNFWAMRESGIRYEEVVEGGRFFHAGGIYRFRLAV